MSGCIKFEDNFWPTIGLVTKKVIGHWEVTDYSINGTSVLPDYLSKCIINEIELKGEKHTFNVYDTEFSTINKNCPDNRFGYWGISSHDIITLQYPIPSLLVTTQFYPFDNTSSDWTIRKLTKKEMWLENDYQNGKHLVKFKKIKD